MTDHIRRSCRLAATLCLCLASWAAAAEQPNFVLIFADDLGYGDVGYQGGNVPTGHIDSIAEGGVVFTDGYVTCPVCAPSRAGMLTGRYQQSFGFWDNIGPFRRNKNVEPGIPADLPILSERLQELGYTTGLFGKTHDGDAEEIMAFNRWDEFYGFNNGASNYLGDMNRSHNPIFHNKKIVSSFFADRGIPHDQVNQGGVLVRDTENYLTDLLVDHAIEFIEANKDQPFLCYIPFNAIHGPFQAPKELVEKYAQEPNDERRRVMAMLDSMDRNIGRVLKALQRNGLGSHAICHWRKEGPATPIVVLVMGTAKGDPRWRYERIVDRRWQDLANVQPGRRHR
jgi:arylsulfatase A-like enzyme